MNTSSIPISSVVPTTESACTQSGIKVDNRMDSDVERNLFDREVSDGQIRDNLEETFTVPRFLYKRKQLWDDSFGDLGLAASHFRVLGIPSSEIWPVSCLAWDGSRPLPFSFTFSIVVWARDPSQSRCPAMAIDWPLTL